MSSRAVALALLCVLAAVAGVAGPAAGGSSAERAGAVAEPGAAGPFADQHQNNTTTVRHRDPDSVDEDGDTAAVASHLSGRLAGLLGNSTLQLSQGQYEAASGLVGPGYRDALGKYVDVAGEVDEEETAERLAAAGETQRELVNLTRQFKETYRAYLDARAAGDESRARELARELLALAERIESLSRDLSDVYAFLENETDTDLGDAQSTLDAIATNTTSQADSVAAEAFVETTLTVSADGESVSFTDPLRLTGTLRAENGTALASRTVSLQVGERTIDVETDAEGTFELDYRPVQQAPGEGTLTVSYAPSGDEPYLGSSASVPVDVEAVTPDVLLEDATDAAGFGERVAASGQVTAGGVGVPGLPVVASVGSRVVARGETDEAGRVSLEGSLPASVAAGDRRLTLRVPDGDRAVVGANASVSLAVRETGTELTVEGESASAGELTVSGRLTTADGRAVPSQSVSIAVNGSVVAVADTGPDGTFNETVAVPEGVDDAAALRARYDGSGTNLESASAGVVVALRGGGSGGDGVAGGGPLSVIQIAGGLLALGVLGLGLYWWRRAGGVDSGGAASAQSDSGGSGGQPAGAGSTDGLSQARFLLDAGDRQGAVAVAYGTVRAQLAGAVGVSAHGTHWEFYRRASEAGSVPEGFERLTELYERATFGPTGVDTETATDALGVAEGLAEETAGAAGSR